MKIRIRAVLLLAVLALPLAGPARAGGPRVIIDDGMFAEIQLVHRMVKMLVEEHTPLRVDIKAQMTPINAWNQMVKGGGNLRLGYDGTVLATFLRQDPSKVPAGMTLYDYINGVIRKDYGMRLLKKLGINNTYAVAVTQETAAKYKLEKISDLAPVAGNLVFGAEHEFFSLTGSMHFRPMTKFYGLKFKDIRPIDVSLKYMAMENGNIDVTVAYATDGLNRKAKLKILADDKHFFPEYNAAILVREDFLKEALAAAPNFLDVVNMLGGQFTDEIMTDLSYEVDVNERSLDDVAAEFLRGKGLIK